jgi:hypothetical protein
MNSSASAASVAASASSTLNSIKSGASSTIASLNWGMIGIGVIIGIIIFVIVYFLIIRKKTLPFGPQGFTNPPRSEGSSDRKSSKGSSVRKSSEGSSDRKSSKGSSARKSSDGSSVPKSSKRSSVPKSSRSEGFYGGVSKGAGVPACLRNSSESAALISFFMDKGVSGTEEGPSDLEELSQILSKMACLQKDLVSPSHIVDATRSLPMATTHDRQPVADIAARCFNKTIPQRDLEISLDTWKDRGILLLRRLCVSANLSSSDINNVEDLFKKASKQCRDILRQQCLAGEPTIAGVQTPRQAVDYTPPELADLSPYQEAPWN